MNKDTIPAKKQAYFCFPCFPDISNIYLCCQYIPNLPIRKHKKPRIIKYVSLFVRKKTFSVMVSGSLNAIQKTGNGW